jgi:hypothetical protein
MYSNFPRHFQSLRFHLRSFLDGRAYLLGAHAARFDTNAAALVAAFLAHGTLLRPAWRRET